MIISKGKREAINHNKKPDRVASLTNILSLKPAFTLTFFLILFFPLVSAVEFDFIKGSDSFAQGETLIAKISGNFLDHITRENIFFYEEHVKIPMSYEVGKINNEFYLYTLLTGKTPGNYSIIVRDVRYMSGLQESKEDIIKNFTITDNTIDFYVKPGFLITTGDFFLEVQNIFDKKILISIDTSESFSGSPTSVSLLSGETKKINFLLNTENQVFENIKLVSENTTYFIPIFVDKPEKIEEEAVGFKFEPKIVRVSMATDADLKRIIYLLNTGDSDIENISFLISPVLEPYVTISPETIDNLGSGSAKQIEIFVNSAEDEMILEGEIKAKSENLTTYFTLSLDFVKDYIPINGSEEDEVVLTTCPQLNGTICTDQQKCTGDSVSVTQGTCCLAKCEQTGEESSTGKYIGWSIVIVVLILLFWFFKRYKRVRPKVDLLKIGQKR